MGNVYDKAAVPELLEQYLSYLDGKDLYACMLVNRQFYGQAIGYLYSDLSFSLYHKGRRKPQLRLWLRLQQCPSLFDHVKTVTICLDNSNWSRSIRNTNIARHNFSACMTLILHRSKNLERVVLINQLKDEQHVEESRYCHDEASSTLRDILHLLPDLPSRP